MSRSLILGPVSAIALATSAVADVPAVVADIPPVHSLVSIVMQGVGTPDLLVQPGASPHGYSMRPSEAKALDRAELVFWIGEGLEPWLEAPLEALASDAHVIELSTVKGTTELEIREGVTFDPHAHEEDDRGDHEDHDDHDDHADHDEHDDHADHDDDGDAHDHEGHDPHVWLDPQNALIWLEVIAEELVEHDAANAASYRANAATGVAQIEAMMAEVSAQLDAVRGKQFVVFHDAYQYFEHRFDIPAAGSIRIGDSSDPSPARIQEIHDKVQELDVTCAFSEPQFNANMIKTVFRGVDVSIGVLDPQGSTLTPGPDMYGQLIRDMGNALADCLQ